MVISVDLDTQAGVETTYDNVTEENLGTIPVFPYAGQAQHEEGERDEEGDSARLKHRHA